MFLSDSCALWGQSGKACQLHVLTKTKCRGWGCGCRIRWTVWQRCKKRELCGNAACEYLLQWCHFIEAIKKMASKKFLNIQIFFLSGVQEISEMDIFQRNSQVPHHPRQMSHCFSFNMSLKEGIRKLWALNMVSVNKEHSRFAFRITGIGVIRCKMAQQNDGA